MKKLRNLIAPLALLGAVACGDNNELPVHEHKEQEAYIQLLDDYTAANGEVISCLEDKATLNGRVAELEGDNELLDYQNEICEADNETLRIDLANVTEDRNSAWGELDEKVVRLAETTADLNTCNETNTGLQSALDTANEEYDSVAGQLDVIQRNCESIDCLRSNDPAGTTGTIQDMLDASVDNGTYVGRIIVGDGATSATIPTSGDILRAAESMQDYMQWRLRVNTPSSDPYDYFFAIMGELETIEAAGMEHTIQFVNYNTDGSLDLSIDSESIFGATVGSLITLSNGAGMHIRAGDDWRISGTYIDSGAMTPQDIIGGLSVGGVKQTAIPGTNSILETRVFGFLEENPSLPQGEVGDMVSLEATVRTPEDGGESFDRDFVTLRSGELTTWPVMLYVSSVDAQAGVAQVTILNGVRTLIEPTTFSDDVDSPFNYTELSSVSDIPQQTSILVDTVCGSLANWYFKQVQGVAPLTNCLTMESVVNGRDMFITKYDNGNVVALVTGRTAEEVEGMVHRIYDRQRLEE